MVDITPAKKKRSPVFYGTSAGIGLLAVYFIILTLANTFEHALAQFAEMWHLILLLVIGFGIQVSLYAYIRNAAHAQRAATAEIATSGGISTGSMIVCCLHHVADVMPFIGLSAAAIFLVRYQFAFIILGIFSNLVGITIMLHIIQKHNLFRGAAFHHLFSYNMKHVRNITVLVSLIIVSIIFVNTTFTAEVVSGSDLKVSASLPPQINSENGVSIEVTPVDFSFSRPLVFEVSFNTHQGSLDFDVVKIAVLEDSSGRKYTPLRWEGSPPGGHHRYGKLIFPEIHKTDMIELKIKDVYGIPERVFVWDLKG